MIVTFLNSDIKRSFLFGSFRNDKHLQLVRQHIFVGYAILFLFDIYPPRYPKPANAIRPELPREIETTVERYPE